MPDRRATLPPDTRSKIPSRRSSASWTRRRGSPFAHRPGAPRLSWRRPCSPREAADLVPKCATSQHGALLRCLHLKGLRGRWIVCSLHNTQHRVFRVKPVQPIPQFILASVRSGPSAANSSGALGAKIFVSVGDMSAYAHELVDNGKDGRLVRALHMMRLRCVATPKTNTPLGPWPHIHGGARHSHAQCGAADHTGQGRPL